MWLHGRGGEGRGGGRGGEGRGGEGRGGEGRGGEGRGGEGRGGTVSSITHVVSCDVAVHSDKQPANHNYYAHHSSWGSSACKVGVSLSL